MKLRHLCAIALILAGTAKLYQFVYRIIQLEKLKREQERIGRTRAEAKLRELVVSQKGFNHVGVVQCGYRNRRGTPRQGILVPSARAKIVINRFAQPESTLDGLENFSHIWVIAVFHQNTNLAKVESEDLSRSAVKTKIKPPRLNGAKVGIFSTRTPHRFNPIALSVCKIERIDLQKGEIYVSGLDLVDQTPVLDIKPYVTRYDSIGNAQVPEWIHDDSHVTFDQVIIEPLVRSQLQDIIPTLEFYDSDEIDAVEKVITEILSNELRSVYRRSGDKPGENQYEVYYDNMRIQYSLLDPKTVKVDAITSHIGSIDHKVQD
jgi:tRNA-Thr(GGU) m(6)t(6)A37 methyltransferase TsaA